LQSLTKLQKSQLWFVRATTVEMSCQTSTTLKYELHSSQMATLTPTIRSIPATPHESDEKPPLCRKLANDLSVMQLTLKRLKSQFPVHCSTKLLRTEKMAASLVLPNQSNEESHLTLLLPPTSIELLVYLYPLSQMPLPFGLMMKPLVQLSSSTK
jgi:hypothetical protein